MRDIVYLDNAATTMKKPQFVERALVRWCKSGNAGRGSHRAALMAAEKIYECREYAAKLFNSKAENVVFTCNATHALNMAIKGCIPDNSHIITSDFEHNSVRRPILSLCREKGCKRDKFSSGDPDIISNIEKLINRDTTAVVCIHRSNITGRTMPVREIGMLCRRQGILFIVDASQSAGNAHIDVDRDNIDVLCAAGHKGLYGPQGSGLLVVNCNSRIKTIVEGGSGSDSRDEEMPAYLPDRLEAGTLSTANIAALCEGIKFVMKNGEENIHKSECEKWIRCRRALDHRKIEIYDEDIPGANFLFNVKGRSAAEITSELDRYGICTRAGLHCSPDAHEALGTITGGAVRASFSFMTTDKEIDTFCNRVRALL